MSNVNGEDIVISGISGRFPESDNIYEFWEALVNGDDLTTSDDRRWPVEFMGLPPRCGNVKNAEKFDAQFFGIDDAKANSMDPQIRIFFEVVYEAIIDAGIIPSELSGSNTAIVLALCNIDTRALTINDIANKKGTVPLYTKTTPAIVSQFFGFTGPAFEIDSACASSFSALFEGFQLMKLKQCDKLIVGGSALHLSPYMAKLYKDIKIASPDGKCKSLDASANGFCRSEAVAAILIEKKKYAKRIHATIKAIETNNGGFTPEGVTYPNFEAQRNLTRSVIRESKLDPLSINYIECHIAGTSAGDPIECRSIVDAYRNESEKQIMLGCLKSNIGHTEEVSALAALTKIALIFQKHCIPPNRNYVTPNHNIAALDTGQIIPVIQKRRFDDEIIPINSLGLGGVNTHALLEANNKIVTQDSFKIVDNIPRLVNISGRTEEGLKFAMNWIESNRKLVTNEFLCLLNDVSKNPLETGMHCRAFMLFDKERTLQKRVIRGEKRRPLWLVFSPLGGQWKGMVKEFASIPIFTKSLHKCAEVLKTVGVNLYHSMEQENKNDNEDVITTFISVVSIQIALVDMLYYIGLQADGIIGHSMGEIAAAYADGCLTLEEGVLIAFYASKITKECQTEMGAMAAVGLSLEQGLSKFPLGVFPACDNSVDGITVAGSKAAVSHFVEQLKEANIFAKVINSNDMAYHCALVASSYVRLTSTLEKVIKNPKFKSSKMISTSTDVEHVKCDANYFASNVVSIVKFREAASKIPQNACIVEIGPSALLLPMLKRSMSNSVTVAMMKKDCGNVENILSAIGHIHCTGNNLNIEKLYPKVEYPVPRETLSLSHLLKWDHSKSYFVANYAKNFNDTKAKVTKTIDIRSDEWSFLRGHCVDERNLFPATGYLYFVWCQYAVLLTGTTKLDFAVEFKDVMFQHATVISELATCVFDISINETTGRFTVVENGSVCVTGYISFSSSEFDNFCTATETNIVLLKREEIYKELRIRGYDFGKTFQLLEQVSADGSYGQVKWSGSWITFLDSVLQLSIFSLSDRLLMMPTSVQYIACNPDLFFKAIKHENNVDVFFDKQLNQINTNGICVKGLKMNSVQRRTNNQKARLTYHTFSPYFVTLKTKKEQLALVEEYFAKCINLLQKIACDEYDVTQVEETCCFNIDADDVYSLYKRLIEALKERKSLEQFFDTLTEGDKKCLIFQTNYEDMLIVQLKQIMENTRKKLFIVEFNDTDLKLEESVSNAVETYFVNYEYHSLHADGNNNISLISQNNFNLVIYKDVSTELITDENMLNREEHISKLFISFEKLTDEDAFLLLTCRTELTCLERKMFALRNMPDPTLLTQENILNAIPKCFTLVGKRNDDFGVVSLIFKKIRKPRLPIFVKTQINGYEWVERIKSILKEDEEKVIWLMAKTRDFNGVISLTRCLKKEPEGERFRCFISDEEIVPEFVLKNDLIMNYFKNDCYGVYIYQQCGEFNKYVEHSHLDIKTKGDLRSLRWYESSYNANQENKVPRINVHYGALNFKDVLVASGRIPHNAYPPQWHLHGNLGGEYSGIDENGNKVMGIAKVNTIATTIVANDSQMGWTVPSNMSLEEAATIPIVYLTVYYSLITRAKLKQNEKVLIHSGSGGVGQAAIAVCLSMNCEVFTSVGTEKKKLFLKNKFPQLQESHFVNTRDVSFEEHILKVTNQKGVDVILNSLAEEKLRASINCLAEFGRFVEIGKFDIIENNAFDPSLFQRNQSFHAICVAHLLDDYFAGDTSQLDPIFNLIKNDLKSGNIKPLNSTVFDKNEVEKAFRFMATGKHIGKVLIKMRDDEEDKLPKPLMMSSTPRTYCSPSKVYILFGGLGGLGLEVAVWLSSRGAKKLVITTRKGITDSYQKYIINIIESSGVIVKIVINDSSTYEKTRYVINVALQMGPIGGIFNLALVLNDALIGDQTPESFENVCMPKINITLHSDQISREMNQNLDYFVCLSSIVAFIGSSGQANYGFANSVMESICEKRREDGLHAVAIQYGPVGDTGSFNELVKSNDVLFQGALSQRIPSFLDSLDTCMNSKYAICSSTISAPRLSRLVDKNRNFLRTIGHILGVEEFSAQDDNMTLVNLGMDSLMAVEVKQAFEREYNVVFSTQEVRHLTIKEVKDLSKNTSS